MSPHPFDRPPDRKPAPRWPQADLADVFEALELLAAGDPTVRVREEAGDDAHSRLRRAVNETARNVAEIVDTAHQMAIGLAEHFAVLERVRRGDLAARIRGTSDQEILELLKGFTNDTIDALTAEIASRRETEQRLQASESRYRALFEKSADASLVLHGDRFGDCNDAAVRMLGCRGKADVLHTHPAQLSPEFQPDGRPSREAADETIRRALEEGSHRFEWVHRRASGEEFPAEVLLTPISRGDPPVIHAVMRDLTDHKRDEARRLALEAQLRQAQKLEALGTLAGGIAHDFNNTLTPILGYAEMAMDDLPEGTRVRGNLQRVVQCAMRARDLVQQILAFGRRDEAPVAVIEAAPAVHEALHLLRATLPSAVEIRAAIDPSAGFVRAGRTHLHQIVMNLCTNGSHAMKDREAGVLTLDLARTDLLDAEAGPGLGPGAYLRLSVGDTGTGIAPAIQDRIFEPFFTTKEVGEGTGMGLSVVHGVVASLGGAVRVESEVGRGSTFHVFLPCAPAAPEPVPGVGEPATVGGWERILLVDDEPDLVDLWTQGLEGLGYQVAATTDSLDALARFEADPAGFDLVLTDQTMPRLTGTRLAARIRGVRPDVPVILTTGHAPAAACETLEAVGVRALLMKPCRLAEIARTVRSVLDGVGLHQEAGPGVGLSRKP